MLWVTYVADKSVVVTEPVAKATVNLDSWSITTRSGEEIGHEIIISVDGDEVMAKHLSDMVDPGVILNVLDDNATTEEQKRDIQLARQMLKRTSGD